MDLSAEQTLKHLGIDRWVLRPAPDAAVDGRAPARSASAPRAQEGTVVGRGVVPAELKAALADSARPPRSPRGADGSAPETSASRSKTGSAEASKEPAAPAGGSPAPSDLAACKVLALGGAGALVLSFAGRQSLSQRVARDLLLSVALTAPGAEPGTLERLFDWDPSALAAAQVSGRRALTAFAQRQLDDAGASRVLITRDLKDAVPELTQALEAAGARCLEVPTLEQLANDAEAKRQLWANLQTLKA